MLLQAPPTDQMAAMAVSSSSSSKQKSTSSSSTSSSTSAPRNVSLKTKSVCVCERECVFVGLKRQYFYTPGFFDNPKYPIHSHKYHYPNYCSVICTFYMYTGMYNWITEIYRTHVPFGNAVIYSGYLIVFSHIIPTRVYTHAHNSGYIMVM